MILLICLILFSIRIQSAKLEEIKDLNFNDLVQLARDTSRFNTNVNDDDVTILLFTRTLKEIMLPSNETALDLNKPTKIIVHGWISNYRRSWYKEVTEEFLKNGDYNVLQVDWEKPARAAYVSSAINTKMIGEKIAQFVTDTKIPPKNIQLVGHSLGAHIAGFAAKQIHKKTGSKVSRISGLDPAGPYFQEHIFQKDERLDKEDADIVDVMHTDSGGYGIVFPLGTLDIYVNGGKAPQPGCSYDFNVNSFGELVEKSFCSHARATSYFIEWINGGKLRCGLCSSWAHYLINVCPRKINLRENEVDSTVTGICVARTRPIKPYL